MEVLDTLTGGAIWGVGFAVALGAARVVGVGIRPLVKEAVKGTMVVGAWVRNVAEEGRENFVDIYEEAAAEAHAGRAKAEPGR